MHGVFCDNGKLEFVQKKEERFEEKYTRSTHTEAENFCWKKGYRSGLKGFLLLMSHTPWRPIIRKGGSLFLPRRKIPLASFFRPSVAARDADGGIMSCVRGRGCKASSRLLKSE